MRKRLIAAVGTVALMCSVTPHAYADNAEPVEFSVGVESAPVDATAVVGRYIVQLKAGEGSATVEEHLDAVAAGQGTQGFSLQHKYSSLNAYSAELSDEQLGMLRNHPHVERIAEDFVIDVLATQNNPEWGLDRIDQRERPVNNSYTYGNDGEGVHIYIMDTGIRNSHEEFTGRIGAGYNAVSNEDAADCNGHGTHVASTAAGTTYGVAKKATIHPVKALGCDGTGTGQELVAAINWMQTNAPSGSVVNMSLGAGKSPYLNSLVAGLVTKGVTAVVAAGNDNQNACNVSPASEASAITVGASTQADGRASFSNFGSCVDIFAPGTQTKAAWYTGDSHTRILQGTSMASPHVAGAAALYLKANSGSTPAQVKTGLLSAATSGVLSGVNGSPNKLLYVKFDSPAAQPDTSPQANETHVGSLTWGAEQEEKIPTVTAPATTGGTLTGPAWADFDLRLQKFDGRVWRTIARSTGPGSNEQISMPVDAGKYRWVVTAYTGFGDFSLAQTMS